MGQEPFDSAGGCHLCIPSGLLQPRLRTKAGNKAPGLVPQQSCGKKQGKHYPSLIIVIIPGRRKCCGYFKHQSTAIFNSQALIFPRARW